MHKRSVVLVALIAVMLSGCATTAQQLTPAQKADREFTLTANSYEAAQSIIVDARRQHLVNDSIWDSFDLVQHTVAAAAPKVRQMISDWRATGIKPDGFDVALSLVQGAIDTAVKIQHEVHK